MKHILLVCSAGMSTSMLAKKMQESADSQGLEVSVKAVGTAEYKEEQADVILLGPQIRYMVGEIKGNVSVPVEAINPLKYGRMDGPGVLEDALALLG